MSVVIDFVNADSKTEESSVFTFEGYPASPLKIPRLIPLIKRPPFLMQRVPFLPTGICSNAESLGDFKSPKLVPDARHDIFRIPVPVEDNAAEHPEDQQESSSQKRKKDDSEHEEPEVQVEHERCESCSTEFVPNSERLPSECVYHPGQKLTDQEVLGEYVRQGRFTAYGSNPSDYLWSCCDERCGETPGCEIGEHISPGALKRRRWAKAE